MAESWPAAAGRPMAVFLPPEPGSHGRRGSEQDRRLAGERAAIAMAQHDVRAIDLTLSAFATDLCSGFDQGEDAVHAGMAEREAAAIGVDRQHAAGGDASALDKAAAFALGTEAEILKEEDRVDRERIVELRLIDIGRRKS